MVYQEGNQLRRYHKRPEPFLSTHDHFYDGPQRMEAPNPDTRTTPHKTSTFAILHQGSSFHLQQRMSRTTKPPLAKTQTVELFPEPLSHTRTIPSSTYRGNGTFTVELPHSSLTYRSLRLVPYSQLSWKSEYGAQFTQKRPVSGYSILSKRR